MALLTTDDWVAIWCVVLIPTKDTPFNSYFWTISPLLWVLLVEVTPLVSIANVPDPIPSYLIISLLILTYPIDVVIPS